MVNFVLDIGIDWEATGCMQEDPGIIDADSAKSSLSAPIIGRLAKVGCPLDDCTGEELLFNCVSIFNNFLFKYLVVKKEKIKMQKKI